MSRRHALALGATMAAGLALAPGALAAAETGLGDMFEYKIEEPVTLPRQKSALLPILNETLEGSRVSIFNNAVLAKHPLLGLQIKNKTELHLAQGPIAVKTV